MSGGAALEELLFFPVPQAEIAARAQRIRALLFADSRMIREPDYQGIHTEDLALMYRAYDREFFSGQLRGAVGTRPLYFRLSRRMTNAAGTTARVKRGDDVWFEITIASTMLFEGFGPGDRGVTACGLECPTRVDALQRVFEHELVHLSEQLVWDGSNCSADRFQRIANGLFGHRAHTHALVTRRERAAAKGIQVGSIVSFVFEGKKLRGRVNRITKRATVLVPDAAGRKFTDGFLYKIYYVPLAALRVEFIAGPE